ncbi:RIO1 family regulatory kinase/ATPase domain-containing protein [Haloarchaeobius sp. TZWWS8]|uniref:RIO1 family regulatory kinase/ATPase domain-containing protein n=1 Tax=Haloarchaeobius sp. TZWWS8 TaxID=3446121 RepID=UPI003EBA95FD
MSLRNWVRGSVPWEELERVGQELARRSPNDAVRIEFLDADNWLSTPMVVDERWFVKVVSPQNSFVHALFTAGRNLGAFSSGTEGFFDHFASPLHMAEHEFEATERMRAIGLNAPEPVETFAVDDLGVLVLEFLPDFRTLDDVSTEETRELAEPLFRVLQQLHENGLAHGDVRGENVLVVDGEIFFIDATSVRDEGIAGARAYDLACALAVLAPMIGARETVAVAAEVYPVDDLLAAREFLDFVNMRPDHDFDAAQVKGELEKVANRRPDDGSSVT